jgi:nitroreductase
MMTLDLEVVDHLLTTTRSVRKRLDFDAPVEMADILRCIEIAIQAPSGSNRQGWRFVVVTSDEKKAAIAEFYRQSFSVYAQTQPAAALSDMSPAAVRARRVRESATYLAENMQRAPVLILPCIEGRPVDGNISQQAGLFGSILPAAWSLMLALRARGYGTAWTTLHLPYEQEVAEILSIPASVTQAALLPVARFTGEDFKPGPRRAAAEVTYINQWGATHS